MKLKSFTSPSVFPSTDRPSSKPSFARASAASLKDRVTFSATAPSLETPPQEAEKRRSWLGAIGQGLAWPFVKIGQGIGYGVKSVLGLFGLADWIEQKKPIQRIKNGWNHGLGYPRWKKFLSAALFALIPLGLAFIPVVGAPIALGAVPLTFLTSYIVDFSVSFIEGVQADPDQMKEDLQRRRDGK